MLTVSHGHHLFDSHITGSRACIHQKEWGYKHFFNSEKSGRAIQGLATVSIHRIFIVWQGNIPCEISWQFYLLDLCLTNAYRKHSLDHIGLCCETVVKRGVFTKTKFLVCNFTTHSWKSELQHIGPGHVLQQLIVPFIFCKTQSDHHLELTKFTSSGSLKSYNSSF